MKERFCFLLLLIPSMLFVSCRDESSTLGAKWLESKFRNVLTDTCTVKLSTMMIDSINTSGEGVALIGYHEDEYFGKITASSYIEYSYATFTVDEDVTYRFDSLTIRFVFNQDYLGDTLDTFRVNIHQLSENVELQSNGYLYNTSSIVYAPDPITTISFPSYPNKKRIQEVALPEELGLEFFNKLLEGNTAFDSQDYFRKYFAGLAFVPETTVDKSILGFMVNDTCMNMTLYYHEISGSKTERTLTFPPSSTLHFNRTEYDRSGTPLESLAGQYDEVPSSGFYNQSCIQGMTGLYTKIEFPYLNNLLEEGELVSIESAYLYLFPVRGTYGTSRPLPSGLSLYTADQNNMTQDQVTDVLGTSVQDGSLMIDDSFDSATYYTFDVTSFLQSNLGAIGDSRQNLQLVVPVDTINRSYSSVILGDMEHSVSNVQLSMLIKIYNE